MSFQEIYIAAIFINEENNSLELHLHSNSGFNENYVLETKINIDPNILCSWIFSSLKKMLLCSSPNSEIVFEPIRYKNSDRPLEGNGIWKIIEEIAQKTQKYKRKWHTDIQIDFSFDTVLFVGESPFYEKCKNKLGPKVLIHKLKLLANATNGELDCFNTQQLLEFIQYNKIRTIYAVGSSFFWNNLIVDGIYIPAILKWIGVELVIYDCDNYNEGLDGYFRKLLFSFEDSRRLSILPQVDKPWDKFLNIPSVRYYPLHDPEPMETAIKLQTDSKLILTSHSRFYANRSFLKPALLLLEYSDEKNILYDFQLLFHTLYYLLHNEFKATILEKMELSFHLSKAFYTAVNLMKYEVLENLDGSKELELYGDEGWALLFPNYYKEKYLSQLERDELVKLGNYTYIIPAINYSYYANNPLYGEVFNLNCPYVCFPSIVQNKNTTALKHLEFSNMTEMNLKISQINRILIDFQDEISLSRKHLKEINQLCRTETESYLFSDTSTDLTYDTLTNSMENDFKNLATQYLLIHSQRVFECFERFAKKDFENLNPIHSKLAKRKYFNILLNFQ